MYNDNLYLVKKFQEADDKAHKKQTAVKIFDSLRELFNSENANSSRRWIWELIQNAKDLAYPNSSVDVRIKLITEVDSSLVFMHNGKNFLIEQLTFLINQVSSKDRSEAALTTGKFGTGFLSTHLLSKNITIEGILDVENGLFKKFHIEMDRGADTIEEMIDKVDKALKDRLRILDNEDITTFDSSEFNTVFTYHLSEKTTGFAATGISDLELCLPYTLIFVGNLGEVQIENKNLTYSSKIFEQLGQLYIYQISETENEVVHNRYIAKIKDGSVEVAVELEISEINKYNVIPLSKRLPRLYCDFPLLGSETFTLPFVLNSKQFNPTEQRHGIYLTDSETKDIVENKELVLKGIELYKRLLSTISEHNFGNLYNLAKYVSPVKQDWFSEKWIDENISKPIENAYLNTPLVYNINGELRPIVDKDGDVQIYVPKAKNEVNRTALYNVLANFSAGFFSRENLPRFEDLEQWASIIKQNSYTINLLELSELVAKNENIENLSVCLNDKTENIIEWLNEYYELLVNDEDTLNAIKKEYTKYPVFVNQKDDLTNYILVKRDDKIEEALKDALEILGEDIRKVLISDNYIISKWENFSAIDNTFVIEKINNFIKNNSINSSGAILFLSSLIPGGETMAHRKKIHHFASFYYSDYEIEREISIDNAEIWERSDKRLFKWLSEEISKAANIKKLTEVLNETESRVFSYLCDFIEFLLSKDGEDILNYTTLIIVPNQHGVFHKLSDLFYDSGLDEKLLDIIEALGWDVREELLHQFIHVPSDKINCIGYDEIANELAGLIKPLMNKLDRTEHEQNASNDLFNWFVDNAEIAKKYFTELYDSKERLLSDRIIRDNFHKANILKSLEETLGFEISTELLKDKNILSAIAKAFDLKIQDNKDSNSVLHGLTETSKEPEFNEVQLQELMLSSGIYNMEGFNKLVASYQFGSFIDLYNPFDRFQWVIQLLNRAVDNVIALLSQNTNYDLSKLERSSITTLTNVLYQGIKINIVVRPFDFGRVIIYYQEELNYLKKTNTQFWIDNDLEQKQLTIGDILESMKLGIIFNVK